MLSSTTENNLRAENNRLQALIETLTASNEEYRIPLDELRRVRGSVELTQAQHAVMAGPMVQQALERAERASGGAIAAVLCRGAEAEFHNEAVDAFEEAMLRNVTKSGAVEQAARAVERSFNNRRREFEEDDGA